MAIAEAAILCKVKEYRQRADLSQAQLAEIIGVKRQAIYDIEAGRYLPNTAIALRLAKHFGCRVEDIFSEQASIDPRSIIMAEGKPMAGSRVMKSMRFMSGSSASLCRP